MRLSFLVEDIVIVGIVLYFHDPIVVTESSQMTSAFGINRLVTKVRNMASASLYILPWVVTALTVKRLQLIEHPILRPLSQLTFQAFLVLITA